MTQWLAILGSLVCTYRMLEALFFIVLSVALSNRDAIVDVVQPHSIVGHVFDRAGTTASLEVCRLLVKRVGPDLDASTFGGVVHGDVANKDVLHDVNAFGILSEGSDRDTVSAVAGQVLDKNVCGVWLERDAICTNQYCSFDKWTGDSPSPFVTVEFWMMMLSDWMMSHPSVFFSKLNV